MILQEKLMSDIRNLMESFTEVDYTAHSVDNVSSITAMINKNNKLTKIYVEFEVIQSVIRGTCIPEYIYKLTMKIVYRANRTVTIVNGAYLHRNVLEMVIDQQLNFYL